MLLRQLRREEMTMKARILESVAARAANGWQRAGSKFDFEVLAMPGGNVMAPALCAYSMMESALKRPSQSSTVAPAVADGPVAERTSREVVQASDRELHCDEY